MVNLSSFGQEVEGAFICYKMYSHFVANKLSKGMLNSSNMPIDLLVELHLYHDIKDGPLNM